MNVCHIITRLIVGGAQENTLLTCEGLGARGHQVTLVTGPDAGPEGDLLAEARSGGYRVCVVPTLRRAVRPWLDVRARRALARLIRKLQPDVVHTHSSKAGILGRLAARNAKVPVIVHTIHGMSFNRTQRAPVRGLYRWAERYCGRFTDRLISVADAMTAQAVASGLAPPERCTTIYSGMRTEWYDPARYDRQAARREWGAGQGDVVVGTVARLFRNKGYEHLISAMALAARKEPRLRFVWVGDGTQRRRYERRLEALGLRSRVYLTGLVEPRRVPEILTGVDLLVHTSQWEGLPRAAVQALLMERPVISFDIDGAPEVVIPGQTGLLVPLNDIQALELAMRELARDGELRARLGRAGRTLCLERFDHTLMVERIEGAYRELLERSARPGRPGR